MRLPVQIVNTLVDVFFLNIHGNPVVQTCFSVHLAWMQQRWCAEPKFYGSFQTSDIIEWFIENQAFSPSYDLAPPPPRPHLLSVSLRGDAQEDWERETTCWRERRGEEPDHTTERTLVLYKSRILSGSVLSWGRTWNPHPSNVKEKIFCCVCVLLRGIVHYRTYRNLKWLSHEMGLAFEDMHDQF